jgi:RND family efflux transporter MFP subunit
VLPLFALTACGEKDLSEQMTEVVRPVKTLVIQAPEAGGQRSFPGRVEAANRATISFQVPGKITQLLVKEGELVKADQTLARLDPKDYQIVVNDRSASYQRAEADFRRARGLVEKGHISRSDFDKLEADFKNAATLLEQARNDLEYTELKAPFSGSIAKRLVDNFEQVNAKQDIIELRDLDDLEIKFQVPERIVQRIKRRTPDDVRSDAARRVHASFEGLPGKTFDLTFKEAATQADPQTQTFEATFGLRRPTELQILPGMTATVLVDLSGIVDVGKTSHLIPASAVVADSRLEPRVWLVDAESMTVKPRKVKTGKMSGRDIEILEGLEPGDRIVTAGVAYIVEGMKVTLLTTPEQANPRSDDPS